MHDNFEKEVQKKMEELNLTPSVPVWEKIELQIRPEKRKRRILVWFFFGAISLSGGIFSYQLFTKGKGSSNVITGQTSKDQPPSHPTSSQIKTTERKENPKPSFTPDNEGATFTQPAINPTKTINGPGRNSSTTSESARMIGTRKERKYRNDGTPPSERHADPETTDDRLKETPDNSNVIEVIPRGEKVMTSTSASQPSSTDTAATVNQTPAIDSVKKIVPQKSVNPPIDSSLRKKAASNRKWKRSVYISAGFSDQIASLAKSGFAMDATIPQNSSGGLVTGGSSFNRKPADITPGLGFMVGYELSRKLNEHFEISVGLRYAYYSTKLKVGDSRRIDTAVQFRSSNFATNQFYTNVGRSDFTNRFHTLQIPFTIHYRPSLNLPLYVSAGASYGRVVSTNALTYSTSSNLYYRNPDNDVHSLLPAHASVQVGLFEKAKTSMRIGPVLQYNLLKLQKENPSNTSHLFFVGVQSTINF